MCSRDDARSLRSAYEPQAGMPVSKWELGGGHPESSRQRKSDESIPVSSSSRLYNLERGYPEGTKSRLQLSRIGQHERS